MINVLISIQTQEKLIYIKKQTSINEEIMRSARAKHNVFWSFLKWKQNGHIT